MKTVTIYTDGACSGNPGPGGWGAILQYGEFRKELSGGEPHTTNNRMELTGVITALEALKEPCEVELYSDSKYVIDALQKGWAKGWRARGWIKSDKKPALNPDLWERLLALCERHTVRLHWVKGHADNPHNNRCDELAVAESRKYKYALGAPLKRGGARAVHNTSCAQGAPRNGAKAQAHEVFVHVGRTGLRAVIPWPCRCKRAHGQFCDAFA